MGKRVLDVGCNCGQLAVNLTQDLECAVTGVDIVPEFVQYCNRSKAGFGEFVHLDFSRGTVPKGWGRAFDVVTCLEVIEHAIHIRGFRDNVCRVLKPGGRLIITTPHPESQGYGYTFVRKNDSHVRMWTRRRLEMVFGPVMDYQDRFWDGREDADVKHIGAVFKYDGWNHPDSDPVKDVRSWMEQLTS